MFTPCNLEEVLHKRESLNLLKPKYSNYFQIRLKNIFCLTTQQSIILKEINNGYNRIYFLSNNKQDLVLTLKSLDKDSVINIPCKNDPGIYSSILSESEFYEAGIYERYYNPALNVEDSYVNRCSDAGEFIACFADLVNFEEIKSLIYSVFNPYLDHLPDDETLLEKIKNRQVLINHHEGKICGTYIFTHTGKKLYGDCWIDLGPDSYFLMLNLYHYMKQNEINYFYFWVNIDNKNVKKIHKLFGCKPDGLLDYTFINK